MVKELREKSGAPMMDCKNALTEAKGDLEQASSCCGKREWRRQPRRQPAPPAKAVSPATSTPAENRRAAGSELRERFCGAHGRFQTLVHDIAMHIAAVDPKFVRKQDVTPERSSARKTSIAPRPRQTGKPAPVIEKIVEGKMGKFYEEVCL